MRSTDPLSEDLCRDENIEPGTSVADILAKLADTLHERDAAREECRKLSLLWKALGDNTDEVEDLTRDRDEYKQQHGNALASWATDRKNLEDAAHRSRCDLLDEQAKYADLTRRLADANQELERWRHGVTIEGDLVCPDSLALSEARAELRAVGKVTP